MILKIDSDDPQSREVALKLNCFRREVGFYRTFALQFPSLVPLNYATGNGSSDEGRWLLLEDLSAMAVGNQVRGVTANASFLVLDAMAQIQARFWNSSALHGDDWLPDHQFWFQGSTELLSSFHSNFLDDYELRVEPEALQTIEFVIENSQDIDETMAKRPSTLVHGDLRVKMFCSDKTQLNATLLFLTGEHPHARWLRWILLISSGVVSRCPLVEADCVNFVQIGIKVSNLTA
ncbi:hypothetical protein [Synechococcus sp. ROS8604]|uniref:hypothetical protein n=1 Tax=Synechococcus sp. ROS8604 TaxID=1442557 RepID=UPI0018631970|nr:hypothetical protein [Synechococcus sp. ROS8604]QNI88582.1 ecdysteroid kinase family protein [Synechococcus sp. ROS8604]